MKTKIKTPHKAIIETAKLLGFKPRDPKEDRKSFCRFYSMSHSYLYLYEKKQWQLHILNPSSDRIYNINKPEDILLSFCMFFAGLGAFAYKKSLEYDFCEFQRKSQNLGTLTIDNIFRSVSDKVFYHEGNEEEQTKGIRK